MTGFLASKDSITRIQIIVEINMWYIQVSWFNSEIDFLTSYQVERSAIHSTLIKLPIVIKIFVLSIFEWPFYTCSTVLNFPS